ncbi:M24 family metallopeptidase [Pseudonocardia hispaniensis]|uniref:M24 family metallopeptidase n=1 Tax=Pseudonocardia hispaniensis TaxID=904933 RepID=A0ABW1J0Q8_9PSEU
MPFPTRREALRDLLRAADLDALLVTDLVNVRYLTGFTGSNAALLVHVDGDGATRFGTDGRYRTQAGVQVPDLEPLIERATSFALAADAAGRGVRRLGFESDHVTVDAHVALGEAVPGVRLERAPGLVQRLRRVKDTDEITTVRAACAVADAALADLLAAHGLRAGRTEREVALDLDDRMRGHGAAGPAFETIVAAGANSAYPHHRPTGVALDRGDLITIDFGALVDGYHSDMTRMFVLGPAADWQRELYELVAAAQAAGRAALAAGAHVREVDAAARDVIVAAGHGERFPHGLGHGVGLQIHEAPALSATGTDELATGMVLTVEPGVYLPGRGGVRIEDTLVVRSDGPDPLTGSPRELLEV